MTAACCCPAATLALVLCFLTGCSNKDNAESGVDKTDSGRASVRDSSEVTDNRLPAVVQKAREGDTALEPFSEQSDTQRIQHPAPRPPPGFTWPTPPDPERDARKLDYIPAARLEEARARVAASDVTVGTTVFTSPDKQTAYLLVRRGVPSEIEEHSRWDDVLVVRAGRGAIEFGAPVVGARLEAPGELRGGRFLPPAGDSSEASSSGSVRSGPYRLHLAVGDVARIPAGVPHAFLPAGPEPFELLIVKVRRPEKPLKLKPGDNTSP